MSIHDTSSVLMFNSHASFWLRDFTWCTGVTDLRVKFFLDVVSITTGSPADFNPFDIELTVRLVAKYGG